jgi:hypothetical protein
MCLKDKIANSKNETTCENVTKHIHLFQAFFEQLVTLLYALIRDEMIFSKMKTMSPSYKFFINLLRK